MSVGNISLCFKKPAKQNNTRVHEDKSIYCALSARSEMQLIYKTGIIIMSGFSASLPGRDDLVLFDSLDGNGALFTNV